MKFSSYVSSYAISYDREKRTDVVKRFEDEIDALRLRKSELEMEIDQMRTEKKKADSKISELKSR